MITLLLSFLAYVLVISALLFVRAKLTVSTVILLVTAGLLGWASDWSVGFFVGATLLLCGLLLLNVKPLRRRLVSGPMLGWFRQVLPPVSETEQEAIDAGTVWWDAELFSGKPQWKKLLSAPAPLLTAEEQAFLDGPTEQLCQMLDQWDIQTQNDLPADVWQFIKDNGFLSMIIPKAYGGLEFSAHANSAVVMKIASRNQSAAVTVMVPNSLGPGELLMHFGTDEQKKRYLPSLSSGQDIPCFALTGPYAGSDAASMPDVGVVCKQQIDGQDVLGLRLSWDKRYITLAPVATVLGLAFRAQDPDGLLGDQKELGITCALIPTETPGVEIGTRHIPTGSVFMNGPTRGKDIFIPMDWVIGGQERLGQGWRMLMHCLAAGRAISLPAMGTAVAKKATGTTAAYSAVRKQFKIPIAQFEGVEEVIARMAGRTYRMDAARELTLTALDLGEKPVVLSAIVKYHLTEGYRQVVNDGFDIHGGKAIIEGPNNYLAKDYQATPVAITVEGANILTRSLIIFGQGAIRCHPYLLREMTAASNPDYDAGLLAFDNALFAHIGFTASNFARAKMLGLTGARLLRSPLPGEAARHFKQIERMSAAFAMLADITLLVLGGKFKFMERLSGRFADVLSHLYMASAAVKRFVDDGQPTEDVAYLDWAVSDSLTIVQDQLIAITDNFPSPLLGKLLKLAIFPFGRPYKPVSDKVSRKLVDALLKPTATRQRLLRGVWLNADPSDAVGSVIDAWQKAMTAAPIESAIANALKTQVTPVNVEVLTAKALETGVITEEQAEQVRAAQQAIAKVIAVDEFPTSRAETPALKAAS